MSDYFPIFSDIQSKNILLFGAGNIAARRLESLVKFGANVTVIAPEISEKVALLEKQYPTNIKIQCRKYTVGEIENADFVLSATDDRQADDRIYDECRSKKIPVNIASDKSKCDFYFPAVMQYDGLTIGICSGGNDHKKVRRISSAIRQLLEQIQEEENADG